MAFLKLIAPETSGPLPVKDVVRRLTEEFPIVEVDEHGGQDHIASMIAATLRVSDEVPGKQDQINSLLSLQETAVWVSFGDDLQVMTGTCVTTDFELFFGSRDDVDGPARPLVERAAVALGYELYEG
jgi:hypothetical protein